MGRIESVNAEVTVSLVLVTMMFIVELTGVRGIWVSLSYSNSIKHGWDESKAWMLWSDV